MFGIFLQRSLFVAFVVCEAPFVFFFFVNDFAIGALIIMAIIFVIYLALNWIFSAFLY